MKKFLLVGGFVRDELLGLKPKDRDYLAVGYTADELISLGFKQVGADFPVFIHPESGEEYALPRVERSTGSGYKDFEVITDGVSVEDDLKRRDLTINAMAKDLETGEIIDPYGGLNDLKAKVLRHTSEAFAEDPLRVLRVARFKARFPDFTIDKETLKLCQSLKPKLSSLTPERVFMELKKALSEKAPWEFFITLNDMRVLSEIFPELAAMAFVEQLTPYHKEGSVFNHSMLVLKAACDLTEDIEVRFAALYHDIGKVPSLCKQGNFFAHYNEDIINEEFNKLQERLKLPNSFVKTAKQVALFHHLFYRFDEMNNNKRVKLFNHKLFPKTEEQLVKVLVASLADSTGRFVGEDELPLLSLDEALKNLYKVIPGYTPGFTRKETLGFHKTMRRIIYAWKAYRGASLKGVDLTNKGVEEIKSILHKKRIYAVKEALKGW